eukprot:COSAG06_NODE_25356_length_639_cov_0.770370_1_plen_25_part_10
MRLEDAHGDEKRSSLANGVLQVREG